MLVEMLEQIPGRPASLLLAQTAVFDLSPELRARAVKALRERPREEYRRYLLESLRYPWAPAADHAAEALVALGATETVAHLVSLLKEPDPTAPFENAQKHLVVREVVRFNHVASCLACHPPATSGDYGSVTNYTINNTSFGKITSMNYNPRVIQIGAYYRF